MTLSLCQVVQIIDWHVHLGVPCMPLLPAFTPACYVPSELPINVLNRQANAACAHWMRYHRCHCPRSWDREGPKDGFGNVSWQVPDLHDLQNKHHSPPSSVLFSPQCAENVTQWLDNALRPLCLLRSHQPMTNSLCSLNCALSYHWERALVRGLNAAETAITSPLIVF